MYRVSIVGQELVVHIQEARLLFWLETACEGMHPLNTQLLLKMTFFFVLDGHA